LLVFNFFFRSSIYTVFKLILHGVFMENKNVVQHGMDKASESMQRTAETMGDTIVAVLDRLAGTQSDVKLSFEELTLDTGVLKATINGAIVLDVIMAKKAQSA
jgi:hypothetical protein